MYLLRYRNTRIKVLVRVPGGSKDLCFVTKVDADGLATFQGEASEKYVDMDMGADVGAAFVYVVRDGEEALPPEVFGKLPILKDTKRFDEVHWVRLSCDRSVVRVTEKWEDFQGFFSGTSTLEEFEMAPPAPPHPETEDTLGNPSAAHVSRPSAMPSQLATAFPALTGKASPVYCHVDVLAARALSTTDPDGLADAVFEVQVEHLRARSLESETRKTLNPTFLQRVVLGPLNITVDLHDGQLAKQQQHLPPIVVRMLDKDEGGGVFSSQSYEVMGQAVITDAQVLQARPGEKQDLNHLHVPTWHGLESDVQTLFEASSLDAAWARRPRVLLAAAFSLSKEVQSLGGGGQEAVQRIYTEEVMNYEIKLDLLGLRAPENVDVHGMELSIPPCCAGQTEPIRLPVTDNFTGKYDLNMVRAFSSKVGNFIPVRLERRKSGSHAPRRGSTLVAPSRSSLLKFLKLEQRCLYLHDI